MGIQGGRGGGGGLGAHRPLEFLHLLLDAAADSRIAKVCIHLCEEVPTCRGCCDVNVTLNAHIPINGLFYVPCPLKTASSASFSDPTYAPLEILISSVSICWADWGERVGECMLLVIEGCEGISILKILYENPPKKEGKELPMTVGSSSR